MTLFVDFNMIEPDGRVPALIHADQVREVRPGKQVVAADGEGTECLAVVAEVSSDQRYVMLEPIEGSWNRDSSKRLPLYDLLA